MGYYLFAPLFDHGTLALSGGGMVYSNWCLCNSVTATDATPLEGSLPMYTIPEPLELHRFARGRVPRHYQHAKRHLRWQPS
jgi:hypothetical protein